jgi:hypothetical protein
MPVIPRLRRLRQEDNKFEVSLGYIVRICFFKKRITKKEGKLVRAQSFGGSVHDWLAYCFWAYGEAEHHGGSVWWRKPIYFMATRKRNGQGPNIPFKDSPPMT